MKDILSESPDRRLIQSQGADPTNLVGGNYESHHHKKISWESIITGLRKYWYVTILISASIMAGVIYKTSKEPRIYKSDIQIAIEKSTGTVAEKLTSNGVSNSESDTTLETIAQKLKSRTMIQKAVENIANPQLRPSVDTVYGNLTIKPVPLNNTLNISYTDTVPQRIVVTLNALSKIYVDYSIKNKKARTDNSIAFIEAQLPESRKRLTASSKEIEEFQRKYKFIDAGNSAGGLSSYRQEIIKKIDENRIEYDRTIKQYEQLKKQLKTVGLKDKNILSTAMLTQDSAYQDLFKKLNDLEVTYSQESLRLTENNPILQKTKEKRDDVLLLLKKRAQEVLNRNVSKTELTNGGISNFSNNLAQSLATKQSELETSLASQKAQYQGLSKLYQQVDKQNDELPKLQQEYTELKRQYNIYSQELTAFLQKLQELKIVDAEQVVPWTVLDPPELPQIPIFPNVGQQMGLGAIGSLFVGLLAAIVLNQFDNRIDNPNTIKSMTRLPILALIPKVDGLEQAAMRGRTFLQTAASKRKNYAYWSFIEAMRILALGIGLTTDRDNDRVAKVVAFTSAVPKEGKSIVTFHTSITLAEMGYRVLLVDVDLYKSSIAELCRKSGLFPSINYDNITGLSDVLLKGNNWREMIQKSPELRLEVLFSGEESASSIALLNSPRFKRTIDAWKQEYDYILFDTPPIVGISDTHFIATLVDGLVYVVSLNVAQQQTIDDAIEIISSIKVPVLGLAINRVDNQQFSAHKYHQYYQKSQNLPTNQRIGSHIGDKDLEIDR